MNKWLLLLGIFLTGCVGPLKPGSASFVSNSGITGTVHQSENPKNESTQKYRRTEETKNGKVVEEVDTTIGAAQKDTARELGAKLASLKGIVWLGALVFLFGATSAFYPPLKVIVGGSVTTSAVIAAAGLALIVLPTLIVGNELLILGACAGAAALYWFAHRHGSIHAELKTLKGKNVVQ
jgi:hypothetical protein